MASKTITFEDVRIGFKNFSGKEGKFNAAGNRNFAIFLEPEEAATLIQDGFNVKYLKPRDAEEEANPQAYLSVKVNFRGKPPKIILLSSKGKTALDEDTVDLLDWADLASVDLIINPFEWEVQGKTGVAAYLKSMYATLDEDELDRKYADFEDATDESTEELGNPPF